MWHGRLKKCWLLVMLAGQWSAVLAVSNMPPPSPDETLLLLKDGKVVELDERFTRVQRDYKTNAITDEQLRAAFRVFYVTDAALAPRFDTWVAGFPKSYVAHLARGIYYKRVGVERRGSEFIGKTTNAQLQGMEDAFDRARSDLNASFDLDDAPLLSYLHAIDISSYTGNPGESRRLFDLAVRLDPHNFIVREKFMGTLRPRWGGSYEKMSAFLEDCREAGLSDDHLRALERMVVEDQAKGHQYEHDYAAAERDYRKAIELGSKTCLSCLADTLMDQKKYDEAAIMMSRVLESQPLDLHALQVRGFAYREMGRMREALADFTSAADQGDACSQNEIGTLYMSGIPGVLQPDPGKAIEWFRKSAAQGFALGRINLETVLRQ